MAHRPGPRPWLTNPAPRSIKNPFSRFLLILRAGRFFFVLGIRILKLYSFFTNMYLNLNEPLYTLLFHGEEWGEEEEESSSHDIVNPKVPFPSWNTGRSCRSPLQPITDYMKNPSVYIQFALKTVFVFVLTPPKCHLNLVSFSLTRPSGPGQS